jgi:uncharacterized protein (DUF433 family)
MGLAEVHRTWATTPAALTDSATRVILRLLRSLSASGIGTGCGVAALDKNPKVKKTASAEGFTPSPGVKSPPTEPESQAGKPPISRGETAGVIGEAVAGNNEIGNESARLVDREGVAYVEGCEVPVWRLEMARRAGFGPAALTAAFPGLTSLGLDLAFAYARRNRAKVDKLIQHHRAAAVPPGDEGPDDTAAFEADLNTLLDKNAEVFRRLAQ